MSKIDEAFDRAVKVADMPHVEAWILRFRELCTDMPPEVFVFVGGPTVLAQDNTGKPYVTQDGGMDQAATVATGFAGHWDGGDW